MQLLSYGRVIEDEHSSLRGDVKYCFQTFLPSCFGVRPVDGLLLVIGKIESRTEIEFWTTNMRKGLTVGSINSPNK